MTTTHTQPFRWTMWSWYDWGMELKACPIDEEWAYVAPGKTLMDDEAPQRRHDSRELFSAWRWIVRAVAVIADQRPAPGGGLPANRALNRSQPR